MGHFVQGRTVTRLRAKSRVDRYGATVADWSVAPDALVISDTVIVPTSAIEDESAGRDKRIDGVTVYMLGKPEILVTDRMDIDSVVYAVDGLPQVFETPFSTKVVTAVALLRVVG